MVRKKLATTLPLRSDPLCLDPAHWGAAQDPATPSYGSVPDYDDARGYGGALRDDDDGGLLAA